MMVEAASYSLARSYFSEVSPRIMIGASAGLTLRYVGLAGRLTGRYVRAALIPACTSRAAKSMSRLRSNCNVIEMVPSALEEIISARPAMWPNWRSRGAATDDAMISALAPGRLAATAMVGKSTCGSDETESTVKATAPAMATATVSSVVATGRRMKGADRIMTLPAVVAGAVWLAGQKRCK